MYCVSLLYFIIVRLHKLKTLRLLAQRSYYFAVHTHKIPIFARSSDVHYLIITNFSLQKSLILALAKLCLQQLWLYFRSRLLPSSISHFHWLRAISFFGSLKFTRTTQSYIWDGLTYWSDEQLHMYVVLKLLASWVYAKHDFSRNDTVKFIRFSLLRLPPESVPLPPFFRFLGHLNDYIIQQHCHCWAAYHQQT